MRVCATPFAFVMYMHPQLDVLSLLLNQISWIKRFLSDGQFDLLFTSLVMEWKLLVLTIQPKKSGNFYWKLNGLIRQISPNICSEIVDYRTNRCTFLFCSEPNIKIFLTVPFPQLSSFQSPIREKKNNNQKRNQLDGAISFGWFVDFGESLTIIHCSPQLVPSDKW